MKHARQHEKVLVVLAAAKGNQVTMKELETLLSKEIEFYRISTYIWKLKTKMGCDIKVVKDGKNVVGYELLNWQQFKDFKPNVNEAVKTPKKLKMPAPVPAKQGRTSNTRAPVSYEHTKSDDDPHAYLVDRDFDRSDDINAGNISDLVDVG